MIAAIRQAVVDGLEVGNLDETLAGLVRDPRHQERTAREIKELAIAQVMEGAGYGE